MPPQQPDRLLDRIHILLNFRAHGTLQTWTDAIRPRPNPESM